MTDHNQSEQIQSIEQSSFFGIITEDVLSSKNISSEAKLLFVKITMYAHKHGVAWPSNKTLADYFGVKERSIQRWIEELKKNNYIIVDIKKIGMRTERKIYPNLNAKDSPFSKNNSDMSKKTPSTCQKRHPNTIRRFKEDKEESIKVDSIPLKKEKKKEFSVNLDSPEMIEIIELDPKINKYFTGFQINIWVKKFGDHLVLKTLRYFLQQNINKIRNPGAWMEKAFKEKYAQVNVTVLNNKNYAIEFMEKNKLKNMKIYSRYLVNTENGKELYFTFPEETFYERINEIFRKEE